MVSQSGRDTHITHQRLRLPRGRPGAWKGAHTVGVRQEGLDEQLTTKEGGSVRASDPQGRSNCRGSNWFPQDASPSKGDNGKSTAKDPNRHHFNHLINISPSSMGTNVDLCS